MNDMFEFMHDLASTVTTLKNVLRNAGFSINTYNSYISLIILMQKYEKKKVPLTFEKLGDLSSKILVYLDEKVEVPTGPEDDILLEEWEYLCNKVVIEKAVSMGQC